MAWVHVVIITSTPILLSHYQSVYMAMEDIVSRSVSFHVRYQRSHVVFQSVTITNQANGDTVTATVADKCESCGYSDLGMPTL